MNNDAAQSTNDQITDETAEARPANGGPTRSAIGLPTALALAAIVTLALFYHQRAGLTYPTPWSDEASFAYPALALARSGSLLAPELNPDRVIHWMPPGYTIASGMLYKIAGFSLGLARGLSLAWLLAGAIPFYLMLRHARPASHGGRTIRGGFDGFAGFDGFSIALVALFVLNAPAIALANTARMETMLLALALASFAFLQRGRLYPALGIGALAPLVHPNGLYFVAAIFVYALLNRRSIAGQASRRTLAIMIPALVAWGAYIIFSAANWSDFAADMSYQFERKGAYDLRSIIFSKLYILVSAGIIALTVFAGAEGLRSRSLLYFAIPSWLANLIGVEMWYKIFEHTAYLFFCAVALEAFGSLSGRFLAESVRWPARSAAVGLVALQFVAFENPLYYFTGLRWAGMRMAPSSYEYMAEGERSAVEGLIQRNRLADRPLRVHIFPEGDALLFQDLDRSMVVFSKPLFTQSEPDIYIIHRSRYEPSGQRRVERRSAKLAASGIDIDDPGALLIARDLNDRWYYRVSSPQ